MRDLQAEWMTAMRRGDYRVAWAISDAVLAARDPAARDDPRLPYHQRWVWDGRDFRGRHVLVRCYHGLGDTLQYARYLAPLRAQAASVTLEVQPDLLALLRKVAGPDRLIPFRVDAPAPPAECDLEIMELAHALRLPPEDLSPPGLGLAPAGGSGIGFCWTGGNWDASRSVPPHLLAELPGLGAMLSLQPGPAALGVANPQGCPAAIAETARLIAGLDLVITVDTMIAHLAGTLGVPTWTLLKHAADWRWAEGSRSAWYPAMRLYRQEAPGAWGGVIARVAAALTAAG